MYEVCPNCGHDFLDRTIEDNEVIYSCESCDWYKIEKDPFLPGVWSVKIHQALAPIDILQSLLTTPDITGFLRPRLKGVSYLGNPGSARQFTVDSDQYLLGEIEIAYQVYLKQMIVLAATYVELILKDFFLSFFVAKPAQMNKVLASSGKEKAMVSLNEILNTGSKEELVMKLAERAALIKGSGEPDKILKTLISECKIKLERPLIDDLRSLKEQRNRIVHEETDEQVDIKQVLNSFGLLLYFLYVLVKVADIYGVPYLDDEGFLRDFESKINENEQSQS
jgi:hypothetical protein